MEALPGLLILIPLVFFYFLPTYIARKKRHRSATSIMILNLVFGWTLIGWIGSLAWAYSGNNNTESPDTHVRCPDCRELVLKDARKCKHCGCALVPCQ
jgi:hypothetical protein